MIRQGILIAGIIGYFFAISELITAISNIVTDAD